MNLNSVRNVLLALVIGIIVVLVVQMIIATGTQREADIYNIQITIDTEIGTVDPRIVEAITGTYLATTPTVATRPASGTTPSIIVPCAFTWATQDLPDIAADIQAAFDDAGLDNVTVSATAYGESCGSSNTIAAMKTNFDLMAIVDELEDDAALGNLAAQILAVPAQFPPDTTPGPQPGDINITFAQDDQQRTVSVSRSAEIIEQGLTGAALWQALNPTDPSP